MLRRAVLLVTCLTVLAAFVVPVRAAEYVGSDKCFA